jgi:hypothetical protein
MFKTLAIAAALALPLCSPALACTLGDMQRTNGIVTAKIDKLTPADTEQANAIKQSWGTFWAAHSGDASPSTATCLRAEKMQRDINRVGGFAPTTGQE